MKETIQKNNLKKRLSDTSWEEKWKKSEIIFVEYEVLIDKLYLLYEEKCNHDHPNQIRLTFYEKDLMFKKINDGWPL